MVRVVSGLVDFLFIKYVGVRDCKCFRVEVKVCFEAQAQASAKPAGLLNTDLQITLA
jgi:hypothetical protein